MIRLGSNRFLILGIGSTMVAVPFGVDAVGAVFFVLGVAAIAAVIEAARTYRPRYRSIWYLFAGSLALFLVGGIAGAVAPPMSGEAAVLDYPGWREPFDMAGYAGFVVGISLMARARLASRDRTITLDALITVGGTGVMAWSTVMSSYLRSEQLTVAGRATGMAFTLISLLLAFMIVRVAIGPGARPLAYKLLALAAAGAFAAEIFLELELSGRLHVANSELLSTTTSALAVVLVGASALHPTMSKLTQPPFDVTPRMTWRRFGAMTVAVLMPPAMLIMGLIRDGGIEAIGIALMWAVLSVMVMIRVYSLARMRERLAEMDRALAGAAAAVAAATGRDQMVDAALRATAEIVQHLDGSAIHWWRDGCWELAKANGTTTPRPASSGPRPGLTEELRVHEDGIVFDLHIEGGEVKGGVLTLAAPVGPSSFELTRLTLLVSDLSRALESSALRDQLVRERSERRFRALVEHSDDVILVVGPDRTIRFVSPAGPRLLARNENDIIGANLTDLAPAIYRARLDAIIDEPGRMPVELQLTAGEDLVRWFDVSSADMTDEPEIGGIVVTAREISARKQAKLDLERSEARFRSLVQHASDLVAVLDGNGIVSWVSPSVQRLLGSSAAETVDRSVLDLAHPQDRSILAGSLSRLSGGEALEVGDEVRFGHREGGWRVLEVTLTDLLLDPSVGGVVLNAHDVTERKTLEQSLRHQALHDDLTGLANRSKIRDVIELARSRVGNRFAVVMLDIDDFKTINDGLGHSVGDAVLNMVALSLSEAMRSDDTVARLGGDEFAVVIENIEGREEVLTVAARLRQVIEAPRETGGREITLHASIGVAFATDVATPTAETMLRSADLAMYRAKAQGKAQVAVFDQSMHDGVFERLELKADLARALDRSELLLHYQPVTNLSRGTIVGFEALMRWRHPERGMVGPATFIPLAEETGLIVPIGRWLIDTALGQLRHWQEHFPSSPPLSMAINVSGRQLDDEAVVGDIASAIVRAGVDPTTVIIELTESVLVEDSPVLVQRLHDIRAIGVEVHADDFGSGFASYSALQSLPFSGVKIDRSLINGLDGVAASRAQAQVRSIIEMAVTTGMRVVAEGIESGSQAEMLRALDCGHAQGYYFARPAAPDAIEMLLRERAAAVH